MLRSFPSPASLTVLPKGTQITLLGGIYCRLPDRSHLAFIALNATESSTNRGLVFCGKIAKHLFDYYNNLIES